MCESLRLWVGFSEVSKSRKNNPVNVTVEIVCVVYKIRNIDVIFLKCYEWHGETAMQRRKSDRLYVSLIYPNQQTLECFNHKQMIIS